MKNQMSDKSDLVYSTVHSFYKYDDINKFDKLSVRLKQSKHLNRFCSLKSRNENTKETRVNNKARKNKGVGYSLRIK